jgi:ribosome-associated protein
VEHKKGSVTMENELKIDTEYITLGQFLKMTDFVNSGGMAKWFLKENEVLVNGEYENRRGRKLRNGDCIDINGDAFIIIQSS